MSLILDIILIAVFALIVFEAAKKGFAKSLLELAAFVLAVVLSFQLSPIVAEKAYDSFCEEKIIASIEEQTKGNLNVDKVEVTVNAMPEFFVKIAEAAGVDIDKIQTQITSHDLNPEALEDKVAEPIVTGALTVVSFVALFILLSILLGFLAELISKVFKLPLIGSVNKLLGALLGVLKGALVVIIVSSVFVFLFANGSGEMAEAVNNSKVIELLDNVNPFIDSLKNLF